jgi:hypothetical protein
MLDASKLLPNIPPALRDPLLESYQKIATNFVEHRWEPSELNGGKFCEVVYTIVDGVLGGSFAARPSKPANMVLACRGLESRAIPPGQLGGRGLRILIPRMLTALYEIRNNRGVGHAGADVDPNFMDATVVYSMASWTLAELIRIFHGVSTQEAQETVDALVERKVGLVWEVDQIRRVLDPGMRMRDQTLVLLYSKPGWINDDDLFRWVEYSTANNFRTKVLSVLHKERLIEYDAGQRRARISPTGAKKVEDHILKTRTS